MDQYAKMAYIESMRTPILAAVFYSFAAQALAFPASGGPAPTPFTAAYLDHQTDALPPDHECNVVARKVYDRLVAAGEHPYYVTTTITSGQFAGEDHVVVALDGPNGTVYFDSMFHGNAPVADLGQRLDMFERDGRWFYIEGAQPRQAVTFQPVGAMPRF